MNRRTYLGSFASVGIGSTAGCLTRIGDNNGNGDIDTPAIDAEEHLLSVEDLDTDWLFAPPGEDDGYDFSIVNPNAILAMEFRFRDIGALLQLAGSRHLTFWRSIDPERIDQLTFIDRRENEGNYEAGAFVAQGDLDREAVVAEAPEFFEDQELVSEREIAGADVLTFESDDTVAVGEDFVILSVEPFRRGRDRFDLVERTLEAKRGERQRYLEENEDIAEVFAWMDEAHLYEAGTGPRLEEGPDDALATGESLDIQGGFGHVLLVAVFETDADAEHATQFDASFEIVAEEALTADTQVRGRVAITEQRMDTDLINAGRGGGNGDGGGVDPDAGAPGP